MTPATKRRWFRWSLRTVFVFATLVSLVVGVPIALVAWRLPMIRENDRYFIRKYIVEGKADPEFQRGLGLFTDEEIDSMTAERDRLGNKFSPQ